MIDEQKSKLSHVWTVEHEKTVYENIELFEEIVKIINNFDSGIKIIICIMPQSKYLEKFHKNYISPATFFPSIPLCTQKRIHPPGKAIQNSHGLAQAPFSGG